MGVCSYCYLYRRQHEECFGWQEAKSFCRISGPEDPRRVANRHEHDRHKARELRAKADRLEAETAKEVSALRREADRLFPSATTVTVPGPAPEIGSVRSANEGERDGG